MAAAAASPGGPGHVDALPGARRLLTYCGLAIVLLGVTVLAAMLYALWQIDESAIDTEMDRARVALAVTARDVPGSEARVASTLANAYALEGAHFGEAVDVDQGEVALAVPGEETRLLIWTPRRFGTELFIQLAPMRISSSLVFLAGIVFLMRRLYLLTRELEERRREAQALAARDTLTGLANRLGFERGLARLLAEGHSNVGLFYLDLDGFKQINDTRCCRPWASGSPGWPAIAIRWRGSGATSSRCCVRRPVTRPNCWKPRVTSSWRWASG